jgi:hypothetical protein
MKKITCIGLFLAIMSTIHGQQSLTRNLMPNVDDTIFYRTIALTTEDFSLTGANYLWDFHQLTGTIWAADTFVDVLSTPALYNFAFNNQFLYPLHKATIASPQRDITIPPSTTISNVYYYYKETDTAYAQVGLAANVSGAPLPVRYDNIDYMYHFPSTMGDIDSCFSSYKISIPTLGSYDHKQTRINEYDGWGTLYTAVDTFEVLRIKTTINARDSVFISQVGFPLAFNTTTIEYKWFSPEKRNPVFIATTIQTQIQSTTTAKYLDYPQNYVSINEIEVAQTRVFPNPVVNQLTIETKDNCSIESVKIYNTSGALMSCETKRFTKNQWILNTSNLSSGSYIIETSTNKGIQKNVIIK